MKSATISAWLSLVASASAVNSVVMKGADFVDTSTNKRFMILGVDYQPGGQASYGTGTADPLSDAQACLRDAALMQELGVNTIRSYNVDPTLNHDQCASIFNEAGIYMLIDVNSPLAGQSIDRSHPSGTYSTSYLQHIFTVVEAFKSYPNTLGFFAGNEIINDVPSSQDNPPYIRAVQRDLKNYISKHAKRQIPVGYSAADVREVLQDTWAYLQCSIDDQTINGNDISRSDFFGLNSYSWCGSDATFKSAGYDVLAAMFASTTIPVFFSEYGCNEVTPRVFDEVQSLYGPQMTALSGGLVYEWSQEDSNYGLVKINSDSSLDLLTDFVNLEGQFNKLDVGLIQGRNSTGESQDPPKCSDSLISSSDFSSDFDIPDPPSGAQALISSGVSNAPTGKIVQVTKTAVQVPVYNTNSVSISGLAIKSVSGANVPGSTTVGADATGTTKSTGKASGSATATATATGSATSASATQGAASGRAVAGSGAMALGMFGAAIMAI